MNLNQVITEGLSSRLIQGTRHSIKTVEATPEEKLDYKPSETAMSVRELAQHIIFGNNLCLQALGLESDADAKATDIAVITEHLDRSGRKLADFAAAADEETLVRNVSFFGGEISTTKLLLIAEWHISRHAGQIDYLQTTWGDMEDRFF